MFSERYRRAFQGSGLFILLFAGVFAGTALVQTQKDSAFAGIFSEYFLNQYAMLQIDYGRMLRYVGSCRIGQYAFAICCGAVSGAALLLGILTFLLGMTWGTVVSISTLRLGLKGVLICVLGIFPQILFYIPAFGWVVMWIRRKGNNRKKYILLAVAGIFFLLFGILAEVYVNPRILQQFLRKI